MTRRLSLLGLSLPDLSLSALALIGLGLATIVPAHASDGRAEAPASAQATTPYVTPRIDVDVLYEATGQDNQPYHQRMRWNADHWQQRLDIESAGLIMLTDYRAHRLSVVDTRTRTFSVSGSPDAQFAPPGTRAAGNWQRGASDQVAGQPCTHWVSTDTDAQSGDFCYSDDGVLLSAARDGVTVIKALSYAAVAQGPGIFAEPDGYRETKPVKIEH